MLVIVGRLEGKNKNYATVEKLSTVIRTERHKRPEKICEIYWLTVDLKKRTTTSESDKMNDV